MTDYLYTQPDQVTPVYDKWAVIIFVGGVTSEAALVPFGRAGESFWLADHNGYPEMIGRLASLLPGTPITARFLVPYKVANDYRYSKDKGVRSWHGSGIPPGYAVLTYEFNAAEAVGFIPRVIADLAAVEKFDRMRVVFFN